MGGNATYQTNINYMSIFSDTILRCVTPGMKNSGQFSPYFSYKKRNTTEESYFTNWLEYPQLPKNWEKILSIEFYIHYILEHPYSRSKEITGHLSFNDEKLFNALDELHKKTHSIFFDLFKREYIKNNFDDKLLGLFVDDTKKVGHRLRRIREELEDFGFTDDKIYFIIESFGIPLGWEQEILDLKADFPTEGSNFNKQAQKQNQVSEDVQDVTLNDDFSIAYDSENNADLISVLLQGA